MDNYIKHHKSLELDKILQILAKDVACDEAKELILNLQPQRDLYEVNNLLTETYDAHMLVGRFGSPSFNGLKNVSGALHRAKAGATLTTIELLRIANVLRTLRNLSEWHKRSVGVETVLDTRFDYLSPNKYLEDRINSCIISEEEISDNASPELFAIRRKILSASSKIREQLDKIIRSATYQKYLQETIITIRNGRFVVPVKAEFRSNVAGLVHDTSSTGATVFIEPMGVVEANNDIKVLKSKEETEIERVLYNLSCEVGGYADTILNNYDIAVQLNVIFAKANLAYKMKASLPIMNDKGIINIKKARHPLIDKEKVVPIDINLGINFDTLVITGPNTGGKTVSLKTIGLLTLMAMCGMMIPAGDNSELSVFDRVLCDIGDEQSIEQSLSTFSSHMVTVINILNNADSKSLVLIDELGAGTDPVEGAVLAISILEKLKSQGAKVISTTHYPEIKTYAIDTDRVENACCEFDVSTLQPTYKLLIGMVGSSNAFAISEKLGMDKDIVERAKSLVSEENRRFDEIIRTLETRQKDLENQLNEAKIMLENSQRQIEYAENKAEEIHRKAEKEFEDAKIQAENIISKARTQAYTFLDELEAIRKKEKITEKDRTYLKSAIRNMENTANPVNTRTNDGYILPRSLKKGDNVLIFDIDKKGVVLETEDLSGNVLVQAGLLKTRVPVSNLRLLKADKPNIPKVTVKRSVGTNVERTAATEVDLRGMTAVEAIMELDRAIDAAILTGMHILTVIHGKGTGVLRTEVQKHLKKHPSIKSYRLGVYGEGENGVTIAELK